MTTKTELNEALSTKGLIISGVEKLALTVKAETIASHPKSLMQQLSRTLLMLRTRGGVTPNTDRAGIKPPQVMVITAHGITLAIRHAAGRSLHHIYSGTDYDY